MAGAFRPPNEQSLGTGASLDADIDEPAQTTNLPGVPEASERNAEKKVALSQDLLGTPPAEVQPGDLYSVFGKTQKKIIILIASTAAFFSPLSSNIYLPVLSLIATDLHVSNSEINLTVTTYLVRGPLILIFAHRSSSGFRANAEVVKIFQGVSPMMIAGFSDNVGRRPAYLICFVLYVGANIGLAVQSSYPALMILRCLQSAGSSGTVALCQAIVSDLATSAERGSFVAYSSVSTILGPTLSPLIGGLLGQYLGWKAIFWFLVIFAVPVFTLLLLFIPETCRSVVGNGSLPPPRLINHSVLTWIEAKKNSEQNREILRLEKKTLWFPNPLRTLVVLANKETALLMLYIALLLGVHYVILTGIPSEFNQIYGFNEIQTSLVYIPYGFGSVVSAFTTGRLANWNYRRHAKRLNFPLTKTKQLDLSHFPIERARIEIGLPLVYFGSAMIVIYGWLLHLQVHIAGPLVALFFIGWSVFAIYQVTTILVIDIYPDKPATATAANNLIRCLFSAGASAIVAPMLEAMGTGWTYTLTGLVFTGLSPCLFLLMYYGPAWRRVSKATREAKKEHASPLG